MPVVKNCPNNRTQNLYDDTFCNCYLHKSLKNFVDLALGIVKYLIVFHNQTKKK